jgi:hypothetical protein
MDFREYYAMQIDTRAQLQKLQHTHLHVPYLKKRLNPFSAQVMLGRFGRQMEIWGQRLQKRYNHEPRLAQ